LKHEFQVGQIVELRPNVLRPAAAGQYEITLLMPEPDVSSESPRYRIKSREEIYHRIVPESDLMLLGGPTAGPAVDMLPDAFLAAPRMALLPIED